jgi:hypothetical protein
MFLQQQWHVRLPDCAPTDSTAAAVAAAAVDQRRHCEGSGGGVRQALPRGEQQLAWR